MLYRKYTPDDLYSVIQLFRDTVHTVCAQDYTAAQLDAWAPEEMNLENWQESLLAHYTIIAEEAGVITGFGDMDDTGHLDRLYVHKDYQRLGIAGAICDRLEVRSFPGAVPKQITTCASVTAKPFFQKRGYHIVKKQTVERRGILLTNYIMVKPYQKVV